MELQKIAEFTAPFWESRITRKKMNGLRIEITGMNKIFKEIQLQDFGQIEISAGGGVLVKRDITSLFMLADITGLKPYFHSQWGIFKSTRKYRLFFNIEMAIAGSPFYPERPAFMRIIPKLDGVKKQVLKAYNAKIYTY